MEEFFFIDDLISYEGEKLKNFDINFKEAIEGYIQAYAKLEKKA